MKVQSIPSVEARPWILNRHYAKRMCPISYAFGIYEEENMIGVVTYGTPLSSTLRDGVCGKEWSKNVLELNRLCCDNKKNVASMLVGRSLNMLPKPSIIVSYADQGQGHVGYVYQATNFIYTGLSAKFKDPMVKGMEHKHHTTIGDEGRGHASRVEYLREKYGSENVYYVERARKHRYIFLLGSKTDKWKMRKAMKYKEEEYPKGKSKNYDVSSVQTQSVLFI
tara:strand:+ start:3126 stop:3794 length:669 start_codon:yes stop_codon:yes gene_type:complete